MRPGLEDGKSSCSSLQDFKSSPNSSLAYTSINEPSGGHLLPSLVVQSWKICVAVFDFSFDNGPVNSVRPMVSERHVKNLLTADDHDLFLSRITPRQFSSSYVERLFK